MKQLLLLILFLLINTKTLANKQFEKDLNILSKLSSFINKNGEPYKINENLKKEEVIIIIYTHGSLGNERKRDTCKPPWNKIPKVIYQLDGVNYKNFIIKTYQLCSGARGWTQEQEDYFWDIYDKSGQDHKIVTSIKDKKGELLFDKSSYATKRKVIINKVNEFKNSGFKNIILAGHSAGAWASLVLNSKFNKEIDGVIAFHPARSGKFAHTKNPDSDWVDWRNYKISEINLDNLDKVLVFTHDKDKYENAKTLSFLIKSNKIRHIDLTNSKCKGKIIFAGYHGISKTKCFAAWDQKNKYILNFIKEIY